MIKSFEFKTMSYCAICHKKVKKGYCPECGVLSKRKIRRGFYSKFKLDVFESDVICAADETILEPLLNRVGISLREDVRDQLRGLRGSAWFDTFKEIKTLVENSFSDYYIYTERVLGFRGTLRNKTFFVSKLIKVHERPAFETEKYVGGTQVELLSITRNLLSSYDETLELWGKIPILRYKKKLKNEKIEIGIRAPIAQYGKAYRTWMRVNNVHMYPVEPIRVGGSLLRKAWVYRVYHTKSWKENLSKKLMHLVSLEEKAVRGIQASRKINIREAKDILPEYLSAEEKADILSMWHGGSLWDLVDTASKVNRTAGVTILKNLGFVKEL